VTRALLERKKHIQAGDLFSLGEALRWLNRRTRVGLSYEDVSADPKLPAWQVAEVPRWLLSHLQSLVARGVSGQWPRSKIGGRHALPTRKLQEERTDYIRAAFVLAERDAGSTLEHAYQEVADGSFKGKVGADAIKRSYLKAMRNLDRDPHYYRRVWGARWIWSSVFTVGSQG